MTRNEESLLIITYCFQAKRGFKYGKPLHHLPPELAEAHRGLVEKGLAFVKTPYRDKSYRYLFLTRKGCELAEKLLKLC